MDTPQIQLPTNRKFGIFFTVVFVLATIYFFLKSQFVITIVLLFVTAGFGLVTLLNDEMLLLLNKLWMRFGLLLGMIVSPIVLGILFFLLFTPIAFLMRLVGRDELRLKIMDTKSYWKNRESGLEGISSFKNQF